MNAAYLAKPQKDQMFAAADAKYLQFKALLVSPETLAGSHADVERVMQAEGRELLRELLQSHLTLRGQAVAVGPVVAADGIERTHVRRDKPRGLETVFGTVKVPRTAYAGRGQAALHPVDADLNLPADSYSHEVCRQVALAAARTSFEATVETVDRTTAAHVPKRQAEMLSRKSAQDFDNFYATTGFGVEAAKTSDLLVLTYDQKGVVLLNVDLTEATRKAAENNQSKLETRRSKGEVKRGRKRMSTVAAVYTVAPYVRTAQDIIAGLRHVRDTTPQAKRPRPEYKRVWASLRRTPQQVIADGFDEADKRDPDRHKTWLVVIDGDPDLERWVRAEAKRRGVQVTLVLDFIHALEYLWKASYAFHKEGTPEAEAWVLERLERLLQGKGSSVAAGIRRSATMQRLSKEARSSVDRCANYFLKRRNLMRYGDLLAMGAPIASGIIEGACRHLICDRLDLTGARWSLDGAEAVLRLRALLSSGDFNDYWRFHEEEEARRNHASRYADGKPPDVQLPVAKGKLRLVG